MKNRSRYVFGAALMAVAASPFAGLVDKANAAVMTAAQFTFETNGGTLTGTSTAFTAAAGSFGPFLADSGTGTAFGVHVSTSAYSSVAGNGSTHSFSSNDWAVGDYYQFSVPTSMLSNIMVSFSATSSSTGPDRFKLQYSTDGANYSDFGTYAIPANSTGGTQGFTPASTNTSLTFAFDLSGVTGLNDNSLASFRLVDNSTLSYGDIANSLGTTGSTPVATGGTSRVDDFLVVGTTAAVPEPTGVALLTAAASMALTRRRK